MISIPPNKFFDVCLSSAEIEITSMQKEQQAYGNQSFTPIYIS
jgi:hypothetical protein